MNFETLKSIQITPISRPLLENFTFIKVTVAKANLRARRGRYAFQGIISYFDESEELQKLKVAIFFQPRTSTYFITNQIKIEEGEDPENKIDQVKNAVDGTITDETLFKEDLRPIKLLMIEAIQHRESWRVNDKSQTFTYHVKSDKLEATITIK